MEIKAILFTVMFVFGLAYIGSAQHKYVQSEGEAAFEGYDLVSYFKDSGPVKGKAQFKMDYDGITLYFASKENQEEFKKKPDFYLPAYGGYCATAVSNQTFVVPNFSNYQIQDDKLLFFEVRGFFNGKTEWQKDPQLNEILADKHYREQFKPAKN